MLRSAVKHSNIIFSSLTAQAILWIENGHIPGHMSSDGWPEMYVNLELLRASEAREAVGHGCICSH
jgi:hypothetical protein